MKDFVESITQIIKAWTGFSTPDGWMPYLIVALVVLPGLVPAYLAVRRWRGDFKAISSEMEAAANLITDVTSKKLDAVATKLGEHTRTIESSLTSRFDALQAVLNLSTEVAGRGADRDVEDEMSEPLVPRRTRLQMSGEVRNAVMQKWLQGGVLRASQEDPNIYEFEGTSGPGLKIELLLLTPYRKTLRSDGRMPFALDIWVDGYKKLNFEWDSQGSYALRGFKSGEWFEDLIVWDIKASDATKAAA